MNVKPIVKKENILDMNNSCLVLAFENLDDLPINLQEFSMIDAYGQVDKSVMGKLPSNVTVHDKFFQIKDFERPETPYTQTFIRHPDPWGEPRNWLQAFAALGECLKGELVCEHWFPSEIIAVNFLLEQILGKPNVDFIGAKQLESVGKWNNYQASWTVNQSGLQKKMLELYKSKKTKILQDFYKNVGQYFDDSVGLQKIIEVLKIKPELTQ